MTTNAKNTTYTPPQSAPTEGEVEHENPTSNADSPPLPQSEPIPVVLLKGHTQEIKLNIAPAFGVESMTPEEPVIPESKGTTAITDMRPSHASIQESGFQYKNPPSDVDSSLHPQAEPIPAPPVGDAASEVTEPVETKRTKAISDMWYKHAYIAENNFKYKSLSNWSLNTAVGCTHGCLFCYVPSTSANKQGEKLAELV